MKKSNEEIAPAAGTTTASIPNPALTAMGPRAKAVDVYDRRRKKTAPPVLLKRFKSYLEDK